MNKPITTYKERFTKKEGGELWVKSISSHKDDKLSVYEDLEESGNLFYLPVKPGDKVYVLDSDSSIISLLITQIQILKNLDDEIETVVCFDNYPYLPIEYYGEIMFSNLEEAKTARDYPWRIS